MENEKDKAINIDSLQFILYIYLVLLYTLTMIEYIRLIK